MRCVHGGLLATLVTVALAQNREERRRDRASGLPSGLWVALGLAIAAFIVGVLVLQLALWYPNSCLAQCIVALRIPAVSRSVEERRAQTSNRANPVEGIPLSPVRQDHQVAPGPIAVGQAIPTSQSVTTAHAIPVA